MAKMIRDAKNKVEFTESVHHPKHYGGQDSIYEAIKIIEHWDLGFNLGNVIKYVLRNGKKDPDKKLEDLEKAYWYLRREIDRLSYEKE
tara:strand:- start:62 stop:325 length:264 start_codon:yes stop_codon:yes gene_type:complete